MVSAEEFREMHLPRLIAYTS